MTHKQITSICNQVQNKYVIFAFEKSKDNSKYRSDSNGRLWRTSPLLFKNRDYFYANSKGMHFYPLCQISRICFNKKHAVSFIQKLPYPNLMKSNIIPVKTVLPQVKKCLYHEL